MQSKITLSNRNGGERRSFSAQPIRRQAGSASLHTDGMSACKRSRSIGLKLQRSENHGKITASIRRYHENQPV